MFKQSNTNLFLKINKQLLDNIEIIKFERILKTFVKVTRVKNSTIRKTTLKSQYYSIKCFKLFAIVAMQC